MSPSEPDERAAGAHAHPGDRPGPDPLAGAQAGIDAHLHRGPGAGADAGGACQTCGDVAVAMLVLEVEQAAGLALCADDEGLRRTVDTGVVGPVRPGETVLVHAGVALARQRRRERPR